MRTILLLILFAVTTPSFGQSLKDCSVCSSRLIKKEQIKELSLDEIRFLKNDLFARKGYKFTSDDLQNYYEGKRWYRPVPNNDKIIYNDIEKRNIRLLQDQTAQINKERGQLITELKNFKVLLLANEKSKLSSNYGYSTNDGQYKYLKEALTKLDLDNINWSSENGLNKVTVDNGKHVMNYELRIDRDGFIINYGNQGGSELGKELYPNEQITEISILWYFEWKKNKIKFLKIEMAG